MTRRRTLEIKALPALILCAGYVIGPAPCSADDVPLSAGVEIFDPGYVARDAWARDWDGDGDGDLIYVGRASGVDMDVLRFYENTGEGFPLRHSLNIIADLHPGPRADVILVDLDFDGDLDVVTAISEQSVGWYETGADPWAPGVFHEIVSVEAVIHALAVHDLDGDMDLDLVVGAVSSAPDRQRLFWVTNNGSNWKERPLVDHDFVAPMYVDVGDIDGDGATDILAAPVMLDGGADEGIVWLQSDAANPPGFSAPSLIFNQDSLQAPLSVVDIDGDGDLDLVHDRAATWGWRENVGGDGSVWDTHLSPAFDLSITDLEVADVDVDGDPDVLMAAVGAVNFAWYENTGGPDPTFVEHLLIPEAGSLDAVERRIDAIDFDGDGDTDVIGFEEESKRALFFINGTPPILVVQLVEVIDLSGDGFFEPGEPGVLTIALRNQTSSPRTEVAAALIPSTSALQAPPTPLPIGTLLSQEESTVLIPFRVADDAECGATLASLVDITAATALVLRFDPEIGVVGQSMSLGPIEVSESPAAAIPDNDPVGLTRTLEVSAETEDQQIASLSVTVDIDHTYRGDLLVTFQGSSGDPVTLFEGETGDSGQTLNETFEIPELVGAPAGGTYSLTIVDRVAADTGTLQAWSISVETVQFSCVPWSLNETLVTLVEMILGQRATNLAADRNGDGRVDAADLVMALAEVE